MDRRYFFERNLLALSTHNPALCSRLSAAETTKGRYKFLDSQSGELIPAIVDRTGAAHALHSTVDPVREAERLIAALKDKNGLFMDGFVIFLGLGAGFAPLSLLESGHASYIMAIDYDINGIAELLCSRDYIALLGDPRFSLLADPSPRLIENAILELYRPALCGGIRVLPLRARVELDKPNFGAAGDAIQKTIEKISSDYSVQAYFGMRWFGNIIRNLGAAQLQNRSIRPIRGAAICAAGPSLDDQIPLLLREQERDLHKNGGGPRDFFVISTDTALSALRNRGLKPDAVVSIDCQHISYYHFLGTDCRDIPLFLDIASPPMLQGFSDYPFFFSGGHPLAAYISQEWRPLPLLDTSGGNVTYACLSLAESLGAQRITVYGADFSYPSGRVYAQGTYIYPLFERKQRRIAPFEAQLSAFLYRSPFLPTETPDHFSGGGIPPYETNTLRLYRKRFEQKITAMETDVYAAPGHGIPIAGTIHQEQVVPFRPSGANRRILSLFAPGKMLMSAERFLEQYRQDIAALPLAVPMASANTDERRVFMTLLPLTAAVKYRRPELPAVELMEAVKRYCVNEIDKILK